MLIMGLDIFEEVVASWLQTKGFFMMNNIKYGNNQEIDILATKTGTNQVVHIEVTCSSNAVALLGTNKAGEKDYKGLAHKYLQKKYLNDKVIEKIKKLTNDNVEIERWFIHADIKNPKQLEIFHQKGIKNVHINEIVKDIRDNELKHFVGDKRIKQLFDIIAEGR